ncbi:YHYH protein [Candidatus Gracilibacteria bacterium]|nr:YHYH protein [Candidatus Gracilibacteria bacterium]
MKKFLAICGVFLLSHAGAFAYTPSAELESQIKVVAEKFEDIIDENGETYRTGLMNVLADYMVRYADNERAMYVLGTLKDYFTIVTISSSNMSSDYTGSYTIDDATYGTKVEVVVSDDTRSITSNALPNHEIGEFPNAENPNTMSAQDRSWELTTNPVYTGDATWSREAGVAYNGVKFELETNERVTCESGETYRIEGFETFFNVMGIDFTNGHVQPTGEYHYHGVPIGAVALLEGDDVVHVGYANDGFPIYYSKLGTYTPSYRLSTDERVGSSCTYASRTTTDVVIDGTTPDGTYDRDWEFVEGLGNLDSCNGTYLDGEYVYFMTDDFPYGPRCLNGETAGQGGGGQGGPGGGQGGAQGGTGERQGPPQGDDEAGDRPPRQ